MAEKENEGKVNKLKRKFSRKSTHKAPVSTPSPSPAPEAASPVSGKSATLPLSYDPKSLALHESHSEGLFSKLRRRFRLGSKGRYDLKSYTENSPSKHRWLRRKSEETQPQSDENSFSLGIDPKNAVGKSNSVKTQRKTKSDKEEVILIRKDKRVSVICKVENGKSEIIFSNVNSPDEDLSETVSEVEEDPYATISSVKDEIARSKSQAAGKSQKEIEMPCDTTGINGASKPDNITVDIDEYPYAKIDPNRKNLLAVSHPSLDTKSFTKQPNVRVRSQIEPDYETLEDIEQKKIEFRSQRNMHSSSFEAALTGSSAPSSFDPPGNSDPDYESLEEVKQRCANSGMSSSHVGRSSGTSAFSDINNAYQPSVLDKTAVEVVAANSYSQCSNETNSIRLSPHLGSNNDCRRYPRTHAASSQGSRPASMPSPHLVGRTSSASSPSALAPLAPSIDSSLPHDNTSQQQASPQEECLYDNPNIILRKQVSRSMTNASTLTRRGQTNSEPPVIKTPAEEELVEKLSSLLAPPLPLRNYQKDEVNLRSGTGSARHSWSSQSSRNIETGESVQAKDIEKSPLASLNHSRENLLLKSAKDSLVSQVYERHDLFSRSSGADILRKKETSTLERYLRKSSPKAGTSSRLLDKVKDNKPDYSVINITKGKLETSVCKSDSIMEKISNGHGKDTKSADVHSITIQTHDSHELDVVSFCHELSKNILEEVFKQCRISETMVIKSNNTVVTDLNTLGDSDPLTAIIENNSTSVTRNTEILNNLANTEFTVNQSNERIERYAKYVSTQVPDSSSNSKTICEVAPLCLNGHAQIAAPDKTEHGEVKYLQKEDGNNVSTLKSCDKEKTAQHDDVLYKMQGARPKVKSLLLESVTKSSSQPLAYSKNNKLLPKHNSNGVGEPKSEVGKSTFEKISQNSHKMNELDFPACVDLYDDAENKITHQKSKVKCEWITFNNNPHFDKDFSIQETVYVDSDSDNELELELNKRVIVHVKRNQRISKVAKPVVYANPRLLENVISGSFKRATSIDTAYLAYGVFRWGRYFPLLNDKRQAVDVKLKAFMNFIIEMLISPARFRRNQPRIRRMQDEVDRMQVKIDKRLKVVQDLPTFQDIRLHLLKTDVIDDWEPEKSGVNYFDNSEDSKDVVKITDEVIRTDDLQNLSCDVCQDESVIRIESTEENASERTFSTQDSEVGDILHSEDSFSDVDEVFSVFNNRQVAMNLPTSSTEILNEFLKLSKSRLNCKYCKTVEESDSEDEMVTVESYAKTVSTDISSQFAHRIGIGSASLCRAFYGELAYTAYMRKHRSARKLLNVPGHDHECYGLESHLSWNNWCSLDSLFKKLVPHICPRLDFQHLLRTYAEFKHFILIERQRNLDHKGCFRKKLSNNVIKCCRFEEFVFLKLIRDEIRHFSHVICMSEASRDLFLEEKDIGFSLLSLLRLVLQNIHKMRRSISKEEVGASKLGGNLAEKKNVHNRIYFRNSSFQEWLPLADSSADVTVLSDQQRFHIKNYENFRFNCLSLTLRNWKSPQAYVHDPNVLVACRTMFAHSDTNAFELSVKGVDEPRPLQEQQDFLESMEQLQWKDWYWGPISYEQATLILKDKEDGSFLVRDSSDQKYLLSLSFKSLGEVHHTRIEHAKGLFSFWSQPESHGKARICEFIEKSIQNSRDGRFLYFLRPSARGTPPLPIRLLTPVSRNFRVATLKHLSRFVVRQYVRKDHLDHLPVPEKVKRYLRDKQYYVEILDDDQWAFDIEYRK